MSLLLPKTEIVRDRAWLDELKRQACILTGFRATPHEAVDPMHLGQLGQAIKSPDDECLPVRHSLHALGHQRGEVTVLRDNAPDWLLRDAFRAYARHVLYAPWVLAGKPQTAAR